MKNLLLALLLLFTLSGAAQIRVMTYNIRNSHAADGVNKWSKRKQSLVKVVLNTDPDVLGTQEVLENQRKDLKKCCRATMCLVLEETTVNMRVSIVLSFTEPKSMNL